MRYTSIVMPNAAATWKFKLLYDGDCPFCTLETRWLQRRDKKGALAFEDISRPEFDAARYGLTREELMGVMHGVFPDGRIVTRVAVFREAYRHIGLGWLLAPTGWPVFRTLANWSYELFARYRVPLGNLFSSKRNCGNRAK